MQEKNPVKEKILLVLLPYWESQIPPMGIACLKSYLEPHGFEVRTADANVSDEFTELHHQYFTILEEVIPPGKRGNFHNVGQDVFRNHMMAHLHQTDKTAYFELIKQLVYHTFYTGIGDEKITLLNAVLDEFYARLERFIEKLMAGDRWDVLGLSVFKGNLPSSMFVFRWVREKYPHIKTVMGGAVFAGTLTHGSPNFTSFLEKTGSYIDKIIVGEGEKLFLKLMNRELDETKRVYTLADIENDVLDLSQVPVPDFSDFSLEFYPNMASYTSRSCPFQCSFCTETVYWGKYRKKKPAQIIEELKGLYKHHKRQLVLMCDSLLNPVVTDLAQAFIDAGISFYWDGYLRVDTHACDADKVYLWRRGGFYRARLGIESGSPHVLQSMDKHISPDQIKTAVINLADAGIKTTTYWVLGHPGETEEDFQQTLDMIEELKESIYEAWCSPFNYYLSGQVQSDPWSKHSRLLYPPDAADLLVAQTWVVDVEPSREEAYDRMNRFAAHCKKLDVPNPYSMMDFYEADERWRKLHKNAVPSIVEFENRDIIIDEHKRVKKLAAASSKLNEEMDFSF